MEEKKINSFQHEENLRVMVKNAISRRKQVLTYQFAKRFYDSFNTNVPNLSSSATKEQNDWNKIESLSQLRSLIGGRFQNLKQRWVNSGFPLRQHRGDRDAKANVINEGWIELSNWISKQGYEVKLAGEDEDFLFAVRKV